MSKVFLISHLGLGDMININGAINFLLQYYNEVNILCKPHYYENVKKIYAYNSNIKITVGWDHDKSHIYNSFDGDIINIGLESYPTKFKTGKRFTINLDPKQHGEHFMVQMYRNAHLNMSIYSDYFNLESTPESKNLYEFIKNYNIIFVHEQASNFGVNLQDKFDLDNENNIVICSNRNYYSSEHSKYEIANKFVNIPIIDYYDVLINSSEIHIVDSCFSSVIIPLVNKNVIKTDKLYMYNRPEYTNLYNLCPKFKFVK